MANYTQWKSKHPENKNLYYVCGIELALCLEVVDAIIKQWPHARVVDLDARKIPFGQIDVALLEQPIGLRVVILRNIDVLLPGALVYIEHTAWLISQGKLPQTILVVYTAEDNPETSQDLYRPFVEKGRFVECKAMSVDNMKKYAMEDYRLTALAADLILELVSYNFNRLNNELEKLSCLDLLQIDENIVRELVVFSADDTFISHLLKHNNTQANLVVSAVPPDSINSVLTTLAKKLAFLYLVVINDTPGIGAHKLAAILGVQPWQLLEYFQIKRYWSAPTILEKLKLLTVIEQHHSSYASNVLPLLCAWWN